MLLLLPLLCTLPLPLPQRLLLLLLVFCFFFCSHHKSIHSYVHYYIFFPGQSLFGSSKQWINGKNCAFKASKMIWFCYVKLYPLTAHSQHIRMIACGFLMCWCSYHFHFYQKKTSIKNKFSTNLWYGLLFSYTHMQSTTEEKRIRQRACIVSKREKNEFSFDYEMGIDWFTVIVNQMSLGFLC